MGYKLGYEPNLTPQTLCNQVDHQALPMPYDGRITPSSALPEDRRLLLGQVVRP